MSMSSIRQLPFSRIRLNSGLRSLPKLSNDARTFACVSDRDIGLILTLLMPAWVEQIFGVSV